MDGETLKLFLLGKPKIVVNGRSPTGLLAKAQALLFYLALEPGAHSRAALAALLWSEMPEEKARGNLRTAVSRLKPQFNDYLHVTRSAITLTDDKVWVDATEFERGLRGLALAERRAALDLYRGDLLADLQLRDAPAFEEWLLVARVRLRQMALDGLEQLAHDTWRQGDAAQALADFRRLLALDAYREGAHRGVMRLLAEMGDRAGALAQFEQCRQILAAELAVEPAPSTLSLHEAIKHGGLPRSVKQSSISNLPSPVPNNLPAATTSFHGRTAELGQIEEALSDPGCRLLTLTGLGGVGKTRLALAVAHHLQQTHADWFPDGVFWVGLTAVTNAADLLAALATHLEFRFNGPDTPFTQLSNFLRHKSLLLLLDNLEQLVQESPLFSELLQAAPGLKLLATSREKLNLYEEWVFPVAGLPFPTDKEAALADFPAAQLFAQRARQHDLLFDLAREAAGVRQICQLVDGQPLGLELAAAWTSAFSCAEIAEMMDQKQASPVVAKRNVPARHHSLQAAFDFSWQLLTGEEKRVLSGLGVFRGGFTRGAAEAVVAATPRLLANLVAKSLVRREEHGRYDLHEQVRQFAWEKETVANRQHWAESHLAYFAAFLQTRGVALKTTPQQQALAEVAADLDNMRGAWETAVAAGDTARVEHMADPLFHFFSKRGRHQEGVAWMETAVTRLSAQQNLPPPLLAKLLVRQGRCGELISKEYAVPQDLFKRALVLARAQDLPEELAHALLGLGLLALIQGKGQESDAYLQECAQVSERAELPWIAAHALNLLAWRRNGDGEHTLARQMCRQAIALQEALGDANGMAAALTTLGKIESDQGDYAAAAVAYDRALKLCRQIGHRVGEAQALTGLFVAASRQGDTGKAQAYAEDSLAVSHDVGNRLGMAIAHHNLGYTAANVTDHGKAIVHFQQALQIYATLQADALRTSNTRRYLAASFIAQGELAAAAAQLGLALDSLPEMAWPQRGGELLLVCAQLFRATGQMEQAATVLAFLQTQDGVLPQVAEQAGRLLTELSVTAPFLYSSLAELVTAVRAHLGK